MVGWIAARGGRDRDATRDDRGRLAPANHGRSTGLGRPVGRHLYGIPSPPIISRGRRGNGIKGRRCSASSGDATRRRARLRRTGKQQWIFHAIPRRGEFGNKTWKCGYWKTTGAANVWTPGAGDFGSGMMRWVTSTCRSACHRTITMMFTVRAGLFGESLVCLDASTGKRVWHFQIVHHGLWTFTEETDD